jgi:hypothetical protein
MRDPPGDKQFIKRCALLICPAMCMIAPWDAGADAEVTISTDRPAVANSSVVVPQAGFQVESGVLATEVGSGYELDFPEVNFRYGLLEKTELRFTAADYYADLSGHAAASGLGDTAIGVKQQLGPIGGFDVSVIAFVSLPSGANAISSHGYDPGVQLPWSHGLPDDWTAGGQLAAYWPTLAGQRDFTSEATFYLDRQITTPCDAFVEYAAAFPRLGGSRQVLHFGTAYKITSRNQLDFHVGIGITQAAPKTYVGIGYSFLLLRR